MKYLAVLVFFFTFINSNAQLQEILIQNEWYLYSVTIDDQVFMPPVNDEIPYVDVNFIDFNSDIIFETHVCNTGNGVVTIDENNYTLTFINGIIDVTLSFCDNEENESFDSLYFSFFVENVASPFNLSLVIIDDPNSNEELFGLEIISPNGDSAFYNSWILSNEEFLGSTFKIFPNPVKDKLYISSATINDFSIAIYSITGKLILSETQEKSANSISVQSLNAGIYFVSISDENGNTTIKKIVKS